MQTTTTTRTCPILLDITPAKELKKLQATRELSDILNEKLAKRMVHIIVRRLPPGDFRVDTFKITDRFLAAGSKHADLLDSYGQRKFSLPATHFN
ncbi:hypothetical protein BGX24_003263 [Mortierella sp. AD032]|nr:hypothetical protein BGX24_003263 [Mortierella sp. AD032]